MKKNVIENKVMFQFLLLSLFGGMAMGVSQIAITLFAIELRATTAQIGLIGGVQGIGLLLTVLPIGFLVDHVGPRKVFIVGAIITALLYLLFPFARSSNSLLYFVGVIGIFTSFRFIPLSTVFLDIVRTVGSDKAGWQRGSNSFGLVFLGPLFGASMSKWWGFDVTFYVISGIVLLLALSAAAVFPDITPTKSKLGESVSNLKIFFKTKNILEAASAETLAIATFSCFNAFIVVIAIRVFHFSPQTASLFVSFQGMVYITTLFSLWRLLDTLGQRHFYLISIMIVVVGLSLLSCLWHPAFLLVGSIFIGIGLGMFNLINVSRIAEANSEKGKTAGLFAMFTVSGAIIGPVIGGFAGGLIGTSAIFLIFIPIYLVLALKFFFTKQQNQKTNFKESKNIY
jgi:MFS family permease